MKDWRSCVAGMRATSKRFAVSGPKCQCRFSSGLIRCTLRLALDQGKQRSTNTTSAPVLAFRTVTYCTENEETPVLPGRDGPGHAGRFPPGPGRGAAVTHRVGSTRNSKGGQWPPLSFSGLHRCFRRYAPAFSSIARSSDDGRPTLSLGVDLASSFPAMRSTCSTARNDDAGQPYPSRPCMVRARAATWCACSM